MQFKAVLINEEFEVLLNIQSNKKCRPVPVQYKRKVAKRQELSGKRREKLCSTICRNKEHVPLLPVEQSFPLAIPPGNDRILNRRCGFSEERKTGRDHIFCGSVLWENKVCKID